MKFLYQILFEVKVLHEYYLTNPDNSSVFQDATQTERLAWLSGRFQKDQPSLTGDVVFALPASMADPFKSQGLILLNSYAGFQVAIQVNETLQPDGTSVYSPAVPLDADFNLLVLMKQVEGQFGLLTNGRLVRPISALYYFSNENIGGAKVAPSLSTPISAQVSGYPYEQGELSATGSQICSCYYTGTTQHFPVVPGNGFVNENDRMIVGKELDYTFLPADKVTQATFTLKDQAGNPARTIVVGGSGGAGVQPVLGCVTLKFDDNVPASAPPLVTLPRAKASDPILYSLEVSGDGGYSKTIHLVFYDQPADLRNTWAVIQMQATASNSNFNWLDASGHLGKGVLPAPDASDSPYPVFEIRCKSRYTFWRYSSDDPTQSLKAPTGSVASFLQADGENNLLTQSPIPSTYLPYFFSTDPGASTPSFTYLPNPEPGTMIEVDGNQLFSAIWVPESAIFPVTPIV